MPPGILSTLSAESIERAFLMWKYDDIPDSYDLFCPLEASVKWLVLVPSTQSSSPFWHDGVLELRTLKQPDGS